jgi:hypothetical protein
MQKVLIFDTSILCVWLRVPGKETCGSSDDHWNYSRVEALIEREKQTPTTFVLPLATIIETGNHIAQTNTNRFELAQSLANLIRLAADQQTPWAAFTDQTILWSPESLKSLADSWPQLVTERISIGDATIKSVAEFYSKSNFSVEILTGDKGLKSYEPLSQSTLSPRYKTRRNQ